MKDGQLALLPKSDGSLGQAQYVPPDIAHVFLEVDADVGTVRAESRKLDTAFSAQSIISVAATEFYHAFDPVLCSEILGMRI